MYRVEKRVFYILHLMLFTGIGGRVPYSFSRLWIFIQLAKGLWCFSSFWKRYLHLFSTFSCKTDKLNIQFFHSFLFDHFMSINWPEASFLQMITGLHQNDHFYLSAFSVKSVSTFSGNNRCFHMLISKLKFWWSLNIVILTKMGGLFHIL